MASSDVAKVRVVGRGGHGSTPQRAADPVPALAEITTALQTMVTRRFDVQDPVVVTVGLLQAGTIANVIRRRGASRRRCAPSRTPPATGCSRPSRGSSRASPRHTA
ncbi:peptidase dimerization domain-containing protein [Tessaracoccus coleopterorum]|uniref:peptidase dimerization domain-containing protein n=1 Tax=Tessaracoccus coleopterorum TaxID=2714950 RepID=UPI001E4464D8|nr:peptidase dimerization domain-containing protein [Tessaracoccus coleopterorum]